MQENKVTYQEDEFGNEVTQNSNELSKEPVGLYAKRTAKNGRELFFLNGKLISKDSIPEEAIIHDLGGSPVEVAPLPVEPKKEYDTKMCILDDGNESKFVKFVNGQFINLCESHYNLTTGKLIQLIREHDTGKVSNI